jgi:hypothetical protein
VVGPEERVRAEEELVPVGAELAAAVQVEGEPVVAVQVPVEAVPEVPPVVVRVALVQDRAAAEVEQEQEQEQEARALAAVGTPTR